MNKEIAKLQRWLDRLSSACDNKKWNSAVAEADCLSAELKQVREELWQKAENNLVNEGYGYRFRVCMSRCIRTVAVAAIILCCSTFPIAVESGMPKNVAALPVKTNSEEVAIITAEEKELLQMLRKNINGSSSHVKLSERKMPADNGKKIKISAAKVKNKAQTISEMQPAAKKAVPEEKTIFMQAENVRNDNKISQEDLLTLIHVGEKHLRGDERAIKIIN